MREEKGWNYFYQSARFTLVREIIVLTVKKSINQLNNKHICKIELHTCANIQSKIFLSPETIVMKWQRLEHAKCKLGKMGVHMNDLSCQQFIYTSLWWTLVEIFDTECSYKTCTYVWSLWPCSEKLVSKFTKMAGFNSLLVRICGMKSVLHLA